MQREGQGPRHKTIVIVMRGLLHHEQWSPAWILLKHLQRDYALRCGNYIEFGAALAKHDNQEYLEKLTNLLKRNPVHVSQSELEQAEQQLAHHPAFKPIYDLLAEYKAMS